MLVKKFEATSIQEALENIKRELGPEAVILQTRRNKRGFGIMSKGSFEVTAAISEKNHKKKQTVDHKLSDKGKNVLQNMAADKQAALYDKYVSKYTESFPIQQSQATVPVTTPAATRVNNERRYVDILDDENAEVSRTVSANMAVAAGPVVTQVRAPISQAITAQAQGHPVLEAEIKKLKSLVEDLQKRPALSPILLKTKALEKTYETLVLQGLDRHLAQEILHHVEFDLDPQSQEDENQVIDQVAAELLSRVQTTDILSHEGPQIIAFVGPTGVGKTTTLAKIASVAKLKHHRKVALINLDTFKVAASDQLAAYAKIMGLPFRSTDSRAALQAALEDLRHYDFIMIDTTGRSQKDVQSLREMEALLRSVPGVRCHLTLSVTTKDTELMDMANRFSLFKPESMVITKLDEGLAFGSILNVSQKFKIPLSYFTTGQRVPEDIEGATAERMVALLLGL